MADEMPESGLYTGLSRKVLEYSSQFSRLVNKLKTGGVSDADWEPFADIVNTTTFERVGVFLGAQAEVIDWEKYKEYISLYGGATDWEGTLRNITEKDSRVILELEERNTRNGETDVSNTVTIYEFDQDKKLVHLDVYVMPLSKRPAQT